MSDLTTRYLGHALKSPLVASASPLCESVDNLRRMEDAGIGAVVLPSLFEEQLELESIGIDSALSRGEESFAESLSYLPELETYNAGPEGYLESIHMAKRSIAIPVIASLNGVSRGGWVQYAGLMQEAGADAIELNLYDVVTDPSRSSAQVEQDYCELISELKARVTVPIAVKLSPFFTAIPYVARRLDEAGADALVLFNRFYQPEFDIESLEIASKLKLSSREDLLLRLHWTAILYGRTRADLALTGGVHEAEDIVKAVMAGASVAMMTSALLRRGIHHARIVLDGLSRWMREHEYESILQMRGSMSRQLGPRPAMFDRVNYMKVLGSYQVQ